MNRRLLFGLTIMTAVCFFISLAPADPTTPQPTGRFQIFSGSTSAAYGTKQMSSTNTILLDTWTGETWLLWPDHAANSYSWFKMEMHETNKLPSNGPTTRPD